VLLVRGASSALGQAAMNIAREAGATVVATTRSADKIARLKALGARQVLLDNGRLQQPVRQLYERGVDCVLDLVGSTVLQDSLRLPGKGGRVCQANGKIVVAMNDFPAA
jgi:NADPH:quinone reductase-like Zn-dependent oxidoreductase